MQGNTGGHDRNMGHYGPAGGIGMLPPPPPPNQHTGGPGRHNMMNRKGGGGGGSMRNFGGGDNQMGRQNNNNMIRNHNHHHQRGGGNSVPFQGGGNMGGRRNSNGNAPGYVVGGGGIRNPGDIPMRRNGGLLPSPQQKQHHGPGQRRRGPIDQGQGPGIVLPPPPNGTMHNRNHGITNKFHPQGVMPVVLPGHPVPPPPPPTQQQQQHLGGGLPNNRSRGNIVGSGGTINMGAPIQQQQLHHQLNGNNPTMMRSPPPPPPPPPHLKPPQQKPARGVKDGRMNFPQYGNGRPQMDQQHRRGPPQQQPFLQQPNQPIMPPMQGKGMPPQQRQQQFPPTQQNQNMRNNTGNAQLSQHPHPQQPSAQQFASPIGKTPYPDRQQNQNPQQPLQYPHQPNPLHAPIAQNGRQLQQQQPQTQRQHGIVPAPMQSPPLTQPLGSGVVVQPPRHPNIPPPNMLGIAGNPQIGQQQQRPPAIGGPIPAPSHLPMAQSVLPQQMPRASNAMMPTPLQQHMQQQQHQRPHSQSLATPPAGTKPDDGKNVTKTAASNWSTHKAPNGVNYYYNSVTKVSTYDRPAEMPPETAAANSTAGTSAVASSSQENRKTSVASTTAATTKGKDTTEKVVSGKWTEYKDQASGKTYYYDGVRTTWDKPDDFDSNLNADTDTKGKRNRTNAADDSSSTSTTPRKKSKVSETTYTSKAEAMAAFKGLLLAKDVSPTLKWNDVVKMCSSDPRWEACSTMGERKQALAEFQTRRANELREQKRQEKVRAKEAFVSLLTEVLPNVRAFNASGGNDTGFGEVRDSLSKDDRFYAVEEETKREELFYDFVEELRKREERQRRGRKRDAKDAFVAFLKHREEAGGLTFASTWTSFLASLDEKDKSDKRFTVSPAMSDSDRQLYFADYVIELQAVEDEKRRRIRDARRRAEKAQRDVYRDTIRLMARQGKIVPSSRWRNFEDLISLEGTLGPIVGPVSEQDRDAPRDMFEDFVEDWADAYRRDKLFLNRLCSSSKSLTVTVDSQFSDFTKALLEVAAYSPDVYSDTRRVINREEPVSSAKLFFNELVMQAKIDGKSSKSFARRRGGAGNRDDSSSDEGEIVEDGEVQEEMVNIKKKETPEAASKKEDTSEPPMKKE